MKQTACKLCGAPFTCNNGAWSTTCTCAKDRPQELAAAHGKVRDYLKDSLVCVYAQLLPRIREAGEKLGYAIALHGSVRRDLDLLAVPWVESAASAEELVRMIARELSGFVVGDKLERPTLDHEIENPTRQPHGRVSWNICFGGHPVIDLSVMPRRATTTEG